MLKHDGEHSENKDGVSLSCEPLKDEYERQNYDSMSTRT